MYHLVITIHLMTYARQVQLLYDASTSVRMFADAMTVALSRGVNVNIVKRRTLYPAAKVARYVHLISAGPG